MLHDLEPPQAVRFRAGDGDLDHRFGSVGGVWEWMALAAAGKRAAPNATRKGLFITTPTENR
jgi:hypothetical protein